MSTKTEEQVWSEMSERLSRLTLEQLGKIIEDEEITVGHSVCPDVKAEFVETIVATRRERCHQLNESPSLHPWRTWNSTGFQGGAE